MSLMKDHAAGVLNNSKVVLFGYDTFDAATNMAIDEVLLYRSESEKKIFVRFYGFTGNTIVLASSDHDQAIKQSNLDGTDLTRRISGGKPIYIHKNVLSYSITGPLNHHRNECTGLTQEIHKEIGSIVAQAIIATTGIDPSSVELGKAYSVRVDGKPIAGHGQFTRLNHSFLYHGVIAVGDWDTKAIESLLKVKDEDYDKLKHLPSLKNLSRNDGLSIGDYKALFINNFISSLPKGDSVSISPHEKGEVVKQAAELKEKKYANPSWIYRDDIELNHNSRFCLLYEG